MLSKVAGASEVWCSPGLAVLLLPSGDVNGDDAYGTLTDPCIDTYAALTVPCFRQSCWATLLCSGMFRAMLEAASLCCGMSALLCSGMFALQSDELVYDELATFDVELVVRSKYLEPSISSRPVIAAM